MNTMGQGNTPTTVVKGPHVVPAKEKESGISMSFDEMSSAVTALVIIRPARTTNVHSRLEEGREKVATLNFC
jgi:hypothetical protein